jgi:hypothetical protein
VTVTIISTAIGLSFKYVGSYFHFFNASSAAWVQKRMPKGYLHINNISFLVQDCSDLHVALNARLSRECRTLGPTCTIAFGRRTRPPTRSTSPNNVEVTATDLFLMRELSQEDDKFGVSLVK